MLALAASVQVFYYLWYGNPATDGAFQHWNHEVNLYPRHSGLPLPLTLISSVVDLAIPLPSHRVVHRVVHRG